jgi:probable HAF family extracellular repeat protein
MSLTSWLQDLRSALASGRNQRQRRRPSSPRGASHRPHLELLEDRCVLAQYAVMDLGFEAVDLNETGQVVGNAGDHAIVLDGDNLIDLGSLGGIYSHATAINDVGQVVGEATLAGDLAEHAFLITPQGGEWFRDSDLDGRNDLMIDLGTLPGIDYSQATAVNNAGQVVGSCGGHAFLWDAVNGMIDLGGGNPTAINENGQVTGYADFPFLWDAVNGMTILDPGPEYLWGRATSINDAGWIVGSLGVDSGDSGLGSETQIDFMWNGHYSIGSPFGGVLSYAEDINNFGQVAGSSWTYDDWDGTYQSHAVLAGAGSTVTLQSPLLNSNVTLQYAQAINDHGLILAGAHNNANGGEDYYLLTPIPPSNPSIKIADAPAVTEGNSGTRTATFTVTLSTASAQTVTVAYATADGTATAGSDYRAASGTLTFAPGQTSKTVTVLVNGDRLPEPNETFVVDLGSPTNATIADGQGQGTILDDEPSISISDMTKAEGKKNQTTLFTFVITLSVAYDQPVTMSFETTDGTAKTSDSDYVAKIGTLTFAPGETTKTITITVNGDSKKEADETFYLDLFGNSGNSSCTKNRGIGKILNDD